MIFLLLTTVDTQHQLREFRCQIDQLEVGFDLLSGIVAQGEKLLSARIIDEGQSLKLPLEAFDGTPFLKAIQELESEWQAILSEFPPATLSNRSERKQWISQQVRRYEVKMITLQLTLDRLKEIRQRARDMAPAASGSSSVITHYSALIDRYEGQLIKAQLLYELALKRMNTR
ncbi:hypothetical protein [Spirosoma pollinicola]|nr:hypothetical protein [Spirosoma pollinicola]